MDREGIMKTGKREITRNQKRGAYVVEEVDSGRRSKKRKYVMVGEDWGEKEGNKEQGLELLIEDWKPQDAINSNEEVGTAPLPTVNEEGAVPLFPKTGDTEEAANTTEKTEGTGPLGDLETENSSSNGKTTVYQEGLGTTSTSDNDPGLIEVIEEGGNINNPTKTLDGKEGTGPLQGNKEVTANTGGEIRNNLLDGASQIQTDRDESYEVNSNQDSGEQLLYNTASNVMRLREAQGDCTIRRGYCITHKVKAVRNTRSERIWTKVKKTGLFGWRTKKLSVLRCPDNTENLVGRMDSRDGAGVT